MQITKKITSIIFLVSSLVSCVTLPTSTTKPSNISATQNVPSITTPSQTDIANAKFIAPNESRLRESIMQYLIYSYKDPDSALIRDISIGSFGCAKMGDRLGWNYGYKVTFNMNIKNGLGAYGGYKKYQYIYMNNGVAIPLIVYINTRYGEFPDTLLKFYPESPSE